MKAHGIGVVCWLMLVQVFLFSVEIVRRRTGSFSLACSSSVPSVLRPRFSQNFPHASNTIHPRIAWQIPEIRAQQSTDTAPYAPRHRDFSEIRPSKTPVAYRLREIYTCLQRDPCYVLSLCLLVLFACFRKTHGHPPRPERFDNQVGFPHVSAHNDVRNSSVPIPACLPCDCLGGAIHSSRTTGGEPDADRHALACGGLARRQTDRLRMAWRHLVGLD